MSVAYQSWEVASGPTMGYKMALQSNLCAVPDGPLLDVSNYSSSNGYLGKVRRVVELNEMSGGFISHRSTESFVKAISDDTDLQKGLTFSNHRVATPQDTVIQGLSSLSLHAQKAGSFLDDDEHTSPCIAGCQPADLNCCMCEENEAWYWTACPVGSDLHGRIYGSAGDRKLISQNVSSGSSFVFQNLMGDTHTKAGCRTLSSLAGSRHSGGEDTISSFLQSDENWGDGFPSKYHFALDVVVEDKPWEDPSTTTFEDLELDTLSSRTTNSVSSVDDTPVDYPVSSGKGAYVEGDEEVQSAYKGPSSFSRAASPPRKGLSRFYAGKSRSFSFLGDALSLKDLAKPESPYAKKRKHNIGRHMNAQLPPLQKGAASISKKSLNNGKSTLALAVAMSSRGGGFDVEDKVNQSFVGRQVQQKSRLSSRSFSLSDLQGAVGIYMSPS